MPAYPGYLENFPSGYQDGGLQRMATRFGLGSLTVSDVVAGSQTYNALLYDSLGVFTLVNPVNDSTWSYHSRVLTTYLDAKRYQDALEYVERFVFNLWEAAVLGQVALAGGGDDA